ncbi:MULTISPECIES: zinc finger-like domain-containing protein [Butyricimonas]|uniref:zinc finger-like domain-containing protein n=1 Tax=Butyricimonas TaxID=574697 RepID=UPI0007FB2386|nr:MULTISPECIES: zinc finger-like domain-containing protein [Butyricimonas]
MKIVRILLLVIFSFSFVCLSAQDRKCYRCHGKGIIYFQHNVGTYGQNNSKKQCPICHKWVPAGVSHSDPCPDCNGHGVVSSSGSNKSNTRNTSGNNNASETYGLSAETQQQMLNVMNGQLRGEEGFLNQNNCYGKYYQYNPTSHVGLNTLTDKIKELNRCSTGAFSANGAGVIVFDGYGFQTQGVPQALLDRLFQINKEQQTIKDVTITDNGTYWCVIYGNCWAAYAPEGVYNQLNVMINKSGISSVALNDSGHYIIVGNDGSTLCSSQYYQERVNEARGKFGKIISASIDLFGRVALCCERGVYLCGAPSSVADVLKSINIIPKVVKISFTGHYLITDGKGVCWYWF